MNINPLDILIIAFLVLTMLIGLNNKFIITLKKTFSIFLALMKVYSIPPDGRMVALCLLGGEERKVRAPRRHGAG